MTSAMPAACAGVVALICVALTKLTPVAAVPPTVTVAVVSKFVPLIVIAMPPAVEPDVGLTPVTVGAGGATYVNWSAAVVALAWPPTVTMTSATPAAWAGVVALSCVALTKLTPVATAPPTVTVAVASKFVPLIVIAVPPLVGPEVGLTPVTVGGGGAMYMNWSAALVALDWPPTVTITSNVPATCAGVVALICVALTTLTLVAGVPPTVTVALASKFVPVIVIAVPPAIGPEGGLTPVTVGAGGGGAAYVNWAAGLVALDWPFTATAPPTVTVAVASKFVPVMVIAVPPAVGPEAGLTPVTVGGGGATYVNWSAALVALDWPPTVTTTSATPAAWAGVVALICVALTKATLVAAVPPTVTVAVASKFVPVMVVAVPPAVGPEAGLTPLTGRGGAG